jgi:hypothetical protein
MRTLRVRWTGDDDGFDNPCSPSCGEDRFSLNPPLGSVVEVVWAGLWGAGVVGVGVGPLRAVCPVGGGASAARRCVCGQR